MAVYTTVDKLDKSVYDTYALRTRMLEQINQELRLDQASSVPPQVFYLRSYPLLSEMELLLGIIPYHTPWAYFFPPKKFIRRSPFGYRMALSLGTLSEQEKLEEKLAQFHCNTSEEKAEKEILLNCFKMINKVNGWLGHIIGRMGSLLPG